MKKSSYCLFSLFLFCSIHAWAGYEVDIQLPKSRYVVDASPEVATAAQKKLDSLSPEERKIFFSTRAEFLRLTAIGLQKLRVGFGIGAVIANRVSFFRHQRQTQKYLDLAETMSGDQRQSLISSILSYDEQMQEKQEALRGLSLKDKGDQVISKFLHSLDRTLWDGAPIVSRANEFGVMGAIGAQFEMGTNEGDKIGGLFDIGVSLGYNRDQKALVFQIFRDKEKFISTQMPGVFIAGVVVKAGPTIANQKNDLTTRGVSFYPPMVPGYSTTTDQSFSAGFSSGLTWPPSPLGDILTYSNSSERRVWLRVTLSPMHKRFFKVHQGFGLEFREILANLRRKPSLTICSALF